MISLWSLLALFAVNVYGLVRLNAKAKRMEERAHTLNVRRRVLSRRRNQLRVRQFEIDCRHLRVTAMERVADITTTALVWRTHLQANAQKEIA